jgi:hypothetical protein
MQMKLRFVARMSEAKSGTGRPATELVVTLGDGRKIATPLDWYPRLQLATDQQRANFEIMPMGIHWPDIDEDLGVAGMLKGRRT